MTPPARPTPARPTAASTCWSSAAGPSGLAAALHARRAGHDVLVVDRRAGVIDKACGEGLLPGALAAVLALGVDPPGHPLAGISYRDATRHADHPFAAGPGRGVRRTALHAALRERALAEGVAIEHATLRALRQDARGPTSCSERCEDPPGRLPGRTAVRTTSSARPGCSAATGCTPPCAV